MKSKISKKAVLIIIGVTLFIAFCAYNFYQMHLSVKKTHETVLTYIPEEYFRLFSIQERQKFKFNSGLVFNSRSPIALFTYHDEYVIEVSKIDTTAELRLDQIFHENYRSTNLKDGESSVSFFHYGFETYYLPTEQKIFKSLDLRVFGDSIKSLKSDQNIRYYHLGLNNLSVNVDDNDVAQIFIKSNIGIGHSDNIPMEIMLLKKQNNLFFILLAPTDSQSELKYNTLINLLDNKISL